MFEKLVESTGRPASARARRTLLAASSFLVASLVAFAVVFSLYNHTLAMGVEPGDIAKLLSPVTTETEPERQTPADRPDESEATISEKKPIRTDHVQRIEEIPVSAPKTISSKPSDVLPRPIGNYEIGDRNWDPSNGIARRGSNVEKGGFDAPTADKSEDSDRSEPKPDRETVPEPPKIKRAPEHIGVVNSRAIYLDKPEYPVIARQKGIKGTVKVQVLIDTEGRVVFASVIDGPGIFRSVSLNASKASRFSPTFVNTTPVSVRGIIIYNFK
ncbi:MAG TPA: energy transducer TonB [Aridibacter sp.]|nr:energy transducer TonB [Aridibacter sp.]